MATDAQPQQALLAAAAALAPDSAGAWALLPPLPATVALQIYNLLAVEERLRAREVSRAWRQVPGGWRNVDLQMEGWRPHRSLRVLELVTKHVAANSILALRVEFPESIYQADVENFQNALTAVVNAHSATLRTLEVSFRYYMDLALLDAVLAACPALESCRLDPLRCALFALADVQQLVAVLKGDGRYSLVALHGLIINHYDYDAEFEHEALLCAAVQGHRSLRKLWLSDICGRAASALALAAARAGVVDFEFDSIRVDLDDEAAFVRKVAQLLNDFPVQRLCTDLIRDDDYARDEPIMTALRNHRSLQTLELMEYADFSGANTGVLQQLTGHPTLTHLRLRWPQWDGNRRFLESLAGVLAASSALTQLSLVGGFGENDFRVIIAGLASPATRLQKLWIWEDAGGRNTLRVGCAARVIGPAVLGCASMREVHFTDEYEGALYDVQCRLNGLLQAKDDDEQD